MWLNLTVQMGIEGVCRKLAEPHLLNVVATRLLFSLSAQLELLEDLGMERRMLRSGAAWLLLLRLLLLLLVFVSFQGCVEAYKNYTVGDSLGWYDNIQKPGVHYQKWVAGKNFSLGDFLIFNTDNNHSVVQTYNFSTYKHCDYDDALENDTYQWSAADPSATNPVAVTVAVPLVREGMIYFFSSDYDGWQCRHGQHLKLNVSHGQGLPHGLNEPGDEAPGPVAPDSGDEGDSAPDTVVPANFNDPKQESDSEPTSGSAALLSPLSRLLSYKAITGFILPMFGFVCLF